MEEEEQSHTQLRKEEIKEFLIENWRGLAPSLSVYQWPVETARWHELVFCLLFRIGQPRINAEEVRRMTQMLADLDLLNLENLAELISENGESLNHPDAILMMDLLERKGMTVDQSRQAVATIVQASQVFKHRYNGKVQRCLRHYGMQMLNDLISEFSLSQISCEETQLALAHWMQNVLNMPIELEEPEVIQFCQKAGIKLEELIDIADDIDINLALMDDMIANLQVDFEAKKPNEEIKE